MAVVTPGNGVISGEIQWIPDQRDSFIAWIRSEFAAANAIIDSLVHHLSLTGGPGEYNDVAVCIEQRRCNWAPVLHFQQYVPITDVSSALQQVVWRRQQQQRNFNNQSRKFGYRNNKFDKFRESVGSCASVNESGEEEQSAQKEQCGSEISDRESRAVTVQGTSSKRGSETESKDEESSRGENHNNLEHKLADADLNLHSNGQKESKDPLKPKLFVANYASNGRQVNLVEGLELYEELVQDSDISRLVSFVNEMRDSGQKGLLQGKTMVVYRRPMRGHGREIIQLGLPITDGEINETPKEKKVEPIPSLLQEVMDRIVQMQILTEEPDYCVIDLFHEGDHLHPYKWPSWYGRPVCNLFLTECEIVFGRVLDTPQRGDYTGSLRLSISPGSLLVMQGNGADLAKQAIPSLGNRRIILTFGKSKPKTGSFNRLLGRPYFPPKPRNATNLNYGAMPGPTIHTQQQMPVPVNVIQPVYIGNPAIPVPGTGVFLPPHGLQESVAEQSESKFEEKDESANKDTCDNGKL